MAIMRYGDWNPLREIAHLLEWRPKVWSDWGMSEMRFPAVDVEDKGNAIVVKAEVPGIEPNEMDVELHENHLVIRGEKREEKEEKDEEKKYYYKERTFGSFYRVVALGQEVDPEKVKAEYKDGVLTVTLEKTETRKARKINIRT
jgi:HSP20 family protein